MRAAWIAGRGHCAGSPLSKATWPRTTEILTSAFHHDRYKELVKRVIREQGLVCGAPALSKGDVLFWAAKTIHGSLRTTEPTHSRRSFTAHFILNRNRFLQYQTR